MRADDSKTNLSSLPEAGCHWIAAWIFETTSHWRTNVARPTLLGAKIPRACQARLDAEGKAADMWFLKHGLTVYLFQLATLALLLRVPTPESLPAPGPGCAQPQRRGWSRVSPGVDQRSREVLFERGSESWAAAIDTFFKASDSLGQRKKGHGLLATCREHKPGRLRRHGSGALIICKHLRC